MARGYPSPSSKILNNQHRILVGNPSTACPPETQDQHSQCREPNGFVAIGVEFRFVRQLVFVGFD